jgi:hypothetical protein
MLRYGLKTSCQAHVPLNAAASESPPIFSIFSLAFNGQTGIIPHHGPGSVSAWLERIYTDKLVSRVAYQENRKAEMELKQSVSI